jgi:hypothetical protein
MELLMKEIFKYVLISHMQQQYVGINAVGGEWHLELHS